MTYTITHTRDDYLDTVSQINKECRFTVGLRFHHTVITLDVDSAERLLADLRKSVEKIQLSIEKIEQNEYDAWS